MFQNVFFVFIEFGSPSGAASNLGLTIVTFADFSDYDDDYGGGVTDRTWVLRLETPRAAIFDRAALRTVLHPCDMYGQILFRRETPYVRYPLEDVSRGGSIRHEKPSTQNPTLRVLGDDKVVHFNQRQLR